MILIEIFFYYHKKGRKKKKTCAGKVQVDADYISSFDHCAIGVWTIYSVDIMTNECLTRCILVNRIMIYQ